MDISIVIVSWNCKEMLRNCLLSIDENDYEISYEFIVVDNASSDGTVEMIKNEFPKVTLLANHTNHFFPKACNQGIKISQGKYILLLNPDTILFPNTLRKMFFFINSHNKVGVIGPKLMNLDGSIQYEGARNFPTLWNMFCKLTFLRRIFRNSKLTTTLLMDSWNHNSNREVKCISGACMLIRKKVLDQVGLLDESLPMYLEDNDICYRIIDKGWIVYYLAEAKITHLGGQSTKNHVKNKILFQLEKVGWVYLFLKKHNGWLKAFLFRIMTFILSIYRAIVVLTGITIFLFIKKENDNFCTQKLKENYLLLKWSLFSHSEYKLD